MSRRSTWGPMSQRVAAAQPAQAANLTAAPEAPDPTPTSDQSDDPVSRVKHCWVNDGNGRLPGLLLEWRHTASGFKGRVVRPVHDPELGWIVVEEWLHADLLEPA